MPRARRPGNRPLRLGRRHAARALIALGGFDPFYRDIEKEQRLDGIEMD
jgi:hypothetical protein